MTVSTDWETPAGEIPRDRWDRPLVVPPDGGKPTAYTRCTTYVGCLEDTYNLTAWQSRMVALGLAMRPDLLLRVSSLGPTPLEEGEARKWKKQMDATVKDAKEAAAASAAATVGTALHALTERMDRGLDVGVVPEQYKPHLAAYEAATRAFTAVHIEAFTVQDELKIGGTPDRVLQIDGHDKLVIGDLKTGSVEFGIGKMAMQLAVYAHSVLYNHQTGSRAPLGDIDHNLGLIVALDAKTAQCKLIWVDLAAGWEAVQLATQVRAWRSRKDISRPYDGPAAAVLPVAPTPVQENARDLTREAAAALVSGIKNAPSPETLIELWRAAGSVWTQEHTELAALRKAELVAARHLKAVPA